MVRKQENDIILFKRMRADDRLALNTLFVNYYQKLCTFANTYLRNPSESEEVVADVFVNLWKNRLHLDIQKSVKAYLYISVKHGALEMIRKRQPLFDDVEDILFHVNWVDSQDPEQSIRVGELQYQLNAAIESLPTRCQQVFKMSRINELTYQEISDVLGISEKTVENHLVKALNIIRDSIRRFERYEASCLNKRVTIL